MLKAAQEKAKKRMDGSIEAFRGEIAGVRTGRATIGLLDPVRVDYYGAPTQLSQIANLGVPEGNMLTVTPWDMTQIAAIEKAILKANLGLTPSSDGKLIRIPVPPLTEQRRKELARRVHQMAEEGRTAVRNVRREANDDLKDLEKDKKISQDDLKKGLKMVQDLTDEHIAKIDAMANAKEKEIIEF